MKYDFSVITAVYNAELYLPETLQSLLRQDIGFSRIQLILIDDGSIDGSGAICDDFQKAHPDNVVVVHKENGGVSSARNEGLKRVQGKYVSFLDADDCLSRNAFRKVYAFFEAHPETDVVSLPMYFFDGKHGRHILNYKYSDGSRVIDLNEEPNNPQLAVTSAFVRADALTGKSFDTRLCYAEDAKLLQSVLIERRAFLSPPFGGAGKRDPEFRQQRSVVSTVSDPFLQGDLRCLRGALRHDPAVHPMHGRI